MNSFEHLHEDPFDSIVINRLGKAEINIDTLEKNYDFMREDHRRDIKTLDKDYKRDIKTLDEKFDKRAWRLEVGVFSTLATGLITLGSVVLTYLLVNS